MQASSRRTFLLQTALVAGLAGGAPFSRADEPVFVETSHGKLRGARSDGVARFLGVPYAAPTGGVNRFLAPRPAASWSGVRNALDLGDRCPQEFETIAQTPVFAWYGQTEPFSEDCGVLNVFTPATDGGRRPVMVYIHGGGYITGGGGGPVLDGSNLARFGDVVVVTLNHRIGVLGYVNLSHLDAEQFGDAANLGQLDLVASLRWIRDNIAAFGGDPNSVTVFGQSGGGSKIMALMGMPAAQGLFHRAINMSGPTGFVLSNTSATEPYANGILQALGLDRRDVRKLQEVPFPALLQAREASIAAWKSEGSRPVVDGRNIPAGPMTEQGLRLHASVPLLMGNAASEAAFHLRGDVRNFTVTAQQLKARIQAQFGLPDEQAEALIAAYRQDELTRTPGQVLVALASDLLVRVPMLRGVQPKLDAKQAPVYVYNFTWRAPVDGGIWGTPHTIDIPFAFGNTDRAPQLLGTGPQPAEVARNLMAAFVAFARTGDPNNARMPAWRPYDAAGRATMTIDLQCKLVGDFHGADRRASWDLRLDPYNREGLFRYRA